MEMSCKISVGQSTIYSINAEAVLGQIATGGGAAHLEEQRLSMDIPAMYPNTFMSLETSLGSLFEKQVTEELTAASKEEYIMNIYLSKQLQYILSVYFSNFTPIITR